jgi:hypothetical protein
MIAGNLNDSLDRYEEMLGIVEKSIKRVGKKVHRCEVMLHNEPFKESEMSEKGVWQKNFDDLLTSSAVSRLPTLREVRLQRRKHAMAAAATTKKTGDNLIILYIFD